MALLLASTVMHLENVGMGSADWPESYGRIAANAQQLTEKEGRAAPAALMPAHLAERIHRAVASTLQVLIIVVFVLALRKRRAPGGSVTVPTLALMVSLFLAFLGVWFGSPLRYPWIVIIDVLGGIVLLALFWWLTLNAYARAAPVTERARRLRPWAVLGLAVVAVQMALGAWTDAYYAALACIGFPHCSGVDWSGADLLRGFGLLGTLDVDASGRAIVDQAVAAAIQMTHRLAAAATVVFIAGLAWRSLALGAGLGSLAGAILVILAVQIGLGAAMVLLDMPLGLVVAHRVGAAVLVLVLVTLIHRLGSARAG